MLTRRQFFYSLTTLGLAATAYPVLKVSNLLEVSEYAIDLSNLSAGNPIRLLHISDIHADGSNSFDFIEAAIDQGVALKPDITIITGDFITRRFKTRIFILTY